MTGQHRGIFGGSFDPVHTGHITVARAALDALALDCLHLIPTSIQPLKQGQMTAPPVHRLAMLRLATRDDDRLLVDDREIRRGGVSYTVETLREMSAEFPGDRLSLLVGADVASELDQWRESDALARLASLVVLTRPGASLPEPAGDWQLLEVPSVPVAASDIRDRLRRHEPIQGLVPDSVAAYIASHRLYCVED
jgi:nicotinate-nucleotide adenylyltransferase